MHIARIRKLCVLQGRQAILARFFIKRNTVRVPSSVCMIGDSAETSYQIDPQQSNADGFAAGSDVTRHQKTINMLFIDGHAENLPKSVVAAPWTNATRFSKPWFY